MQRVIFHPDAFKELEQARAWYEQQAPGLGNQFFEEVELAVERIRESPDMWSAYTKNTRRFLIHRFPFAVVYCQDQSNIQIIAVMNLSRKPGYWRHREF